MSETHDDRRWTSLIQALELVAAAPSEQVSALPELRRIAAEIQRGEPPPALLDAELVREGLLPAEVGFLITRIDELYGELIADDPERTFTEQALRQDARFGLARALAREALEQLGLRPPLRRL